jgi:hypothetical protein
VVALVADAQDAGDKVTAEKEEERRFRVGTPLSLEFVWEGLVAWPFRKGKIQRILTVRFKAP